MDEREVQAVLEQVSSRLQTGMTEIDAHLREPWWKPYLVDVPPGRVGRAEVRRVTVTELGAFVHNLREANHGRRRGIPPGEFTQLWVGQSMWMSDTPAELGDLDPFRLRVRSGHRVLIHGLGLGCAVKMAFECGASTVDVVERDVDVILLVGEHWRRRYGPRLCIMHGDALTWKPPRGARWDVVWHDIWEHVASRNLPDMRKLHRRFARRAGWQGSWLRAEVARMARREAREDVEYRAMATRLRASLFGR